MPNEASVNIFKSQTEAAAMAAEMGQLNYDVMTIGPVSLVMVADHDNGKHDFETPDGGKYYIVTASNKS